MIKRTIENEAKLLMKEFPITAILGPRQSGKTTLAQKLFPKYAYVSLEDIDHRNFAQNDPRGFLERYSKNVIFDEIQKTPELISYMQTKVDQSKQKGQFVITGSHNFLLMEQISQSLAGRVGIARLLPFSCFEVEQYGITNVDELIFGGFYPRIYEEHIRPKTFYKNYISTYIEKDLRQLKNIDKLETFIKFMKILAGRTGQILNTKSISEDCGISHNTVNEWISVLETSFVICKLKPYHKNYNKRIIKSPKIYFTDTGLVCSLLGIRKHQDFDYHFLKGQIFETYVVGELLKGNYNNGEIYDIFYWKDNHKKEIDIIIDFGSSHFAIEVKSGKTVQEKYFDNLKYWHQVSNADYENLYLIYGGDGHYKRNNINVVGWNMIEKKIIKPIGKGVF